MRKLIAAINVTVDGYCNHDAVDPDDKIHDHYTELLKSADVVLYGRKTFQLMEFWKTILEDPHAEKSMTDFAQAMDNIEKVVFSQTMKETNWKSARLAKSDLKKEILKLKQSSGKDILVGSPGLIIQSLNLNLVDELQLCVHPLIVGKGMILFKDIQERISLKLIKTKTFDCGAVIFYYGVNNPRII